MSLHIGAEIKMLILIFLRTVYTLQGISTKQKGTIPSISIWVHSLVILFIIVNLLFIVYVLKKFFKRKYTHMNLLSYKDNKNIFVSKNVEITFNEVSGPKKEYNEPLIQTEDYVATHSIIVKNEPEIDRYVPKSSKLLRLNINMNSVNSHKKNKFSGGEPKLSKYFVYEDSESLMLEMELDRIYNYKWYEGYNENKEVCFEADTDVEHSSSVSYHEGEVFSIATNGDPNITNITAKEAMGPMGRFTFTEKYSV